MLRAITSFNIKSELFYLLALNGHISEKTKRHLDYRQERNTCRQEKSSKHMKEQIAHNPNWYKVQLKKARKPIVQLLLAKEH
jgi:hypothetical protein